MSTTKSPVMTMTLKSETEFPKALKNLVLSMGMQGEAVYKGFPVIDVGEEYWWVQLHLYKNKEDTTALKTTISQLQGDMEKLVSELSVQGDLIKTKDEQIANLQKQLDQNNGSA
jgi:hypothetical protein